uniref:Uncharacterized protein n=1 Tax=viral metagenome TaxID=1070528 RepID=A0A6M3JMX5_9ZZZZ
MAGLGITALGFQRAGYCKKYRYEIESLAADSIELDIILVIPYKGLITGFTIICPTGGDFGFWLSTSTGLAISNQDVKISATHADTIHRLTKQLIRYFNNIGTQYTNELYLTLWNNSIKFALGVTAVEIVINENGNDRSN